MSRLYDKGSIFPIDDIDKLYRIMIHNQEIIPQFKELKLGF